MNKPKEIKPEKESSPKAAGKEGASKKGNGFGRAFISFMDGSFLTRENVSQLMPFILYLTFLGIVYISNTYYAEKNLIQIERINTEMKELKAEYITSKSELMFVSNQSTVARSVEALGLKEMTSAPRKIVIREQ